MGGNFPSEAEKCNFQTQFAKFGAFLLQHFTENPLLFSNEILAMIMFYVYSSHLSFFFYDKVLAITMSIPPTFSVLIPLPELLLIFGH